MVKRILILGSSRSNGNTSKIVESLKNYLEFDVIDLNDYTFSYYDYLHENKDDDFIPLIKRIIKYDQILFATPVYWYTMSGILKVFFDRLSDCLSIEKALGRQLKNKSMSVLCCGSTEEKVEGFFLPFQLSAKYLGMHYLAEIHTWIENNTINKDVDKQIKKFAAEHL